MFLLLFFVIKGLHCSRCTKITGCTGCEVNSEDVILTLQPCDNLAVQLGNISRWEAERVRNFVILPKIWAAGEDFHNPGIKLKWSKKKIVNWQTLQTKLIYHPILQQLKFLVRCWCRYLNLVWADGKEARSEKREVQFFPFAVNVDLLLNRK